jgi:hypothetical protein
MSELSTAAILADPSAYGISFPVSKLHKGIGAERVELPLSPILTVTDFGKFEQNFPGVLLKHSNGQSVRVHAQSIARNMVWANRKVSHAEISAAQIDGILFGRVVTVATKVVNVGLSTEKAAALFADLVDSGLSTEVARGIVERAQQV